MKTFSIRIEEDLFDKVEAARGDKARTDFIREVILSYFVTKSSPELNQNSPELLKEIELKNEIIRAKDQTIKSLENQVGFLIADHSRISGQLDRLLIPSQEEQKEKGKKWFEFWKK
jgi:hypothetical protein